MGMINFNVPPYTGKEMEYMREAVENQKICGDGPFTKRCSEWIEKETGTAKCLLTTSCTHATEMAALLADIKPGDEVIMPSYTFVSTADAFVLRGATAVFVDIRPDTMNIDEKLIEDAVTERTRAIAPVHYAGEGGALLIRDENYIEDEEIIREKGTDRSKYYRGQVDKYRWQNYGSSYLPSDMNAAYLYAQLEIGGEITQARLDRWNQYYELLAPLAKEGLIELPYVPEHCTHNGHMFFIKTKDLEERTRLIDFLKEKNIMAVSHYVTLHSAPAGLKFGRFHGEDRYTTKESDRLLRLPMFYKLTAEETGYIGEQVKAFYRQ